MGIPGLFGWLLKNYGRNRFISQKMNSSVDELYIDANCMIHPSCLKISNETTKHIPIEKLENVMINQCIYDLDYLIKYVNPKTKIYVAVDGVAPLAKIYQQRKRRYKSYEETQLKNAIKTKYGKEIVNKWTNASITPGTEFMEKLHIVIQKYLNTLNTPNEIIYSSYHTCGEGEHKIFDHIRKFGQNKCLNRVIYGLDADLIFLSLACNKKNLFLIRESAELSQQSQTHFVYVSIDNVSKCFNDHLREQIAREVYNSGLSKNIPDDLINDIIFVCYFLGNDFLPHVPTIDIKKDGLDMLIDAYVITFVKYFSKLIKRDDNGVVIDMLFFDDFLTKMSEYEKEWLCNCDDQFMFERENMIEPRFNDPIDRELWRLDNMRIIKRGDVYKKYIGTFDDWKFRYYEQNYGCSDSQEQIIKKSCQNYLDGVKWITQYYFDGCKSWDWVYKFTHAPFICDLSKFIKTQHYNMNSIKFDVGSPLPASVQLLCVIPPQYSHLLDNSFANLLSDDSPIGYMFPKNFMLDTLNKDLYWQCIPILPNIDTDKIISYTNKISKSDRILTVDKKMDDIHIK